MQSTNSEIFPHQSLITHSTKFLSTEKPSSSSMASLRFLLTGTAASLKNYLFSKNTPPKLAATSLAPRLQLLSITPSRMLISSTFTTFRPPPAAKYSTDSESEYSDTDSEAVQQSFKPAVYDRVIYPYANPFLITGNRSIIEMQSDVEEARLRVDMPGVDKEGVKIWFEKGELKIEGVEMIAAEDGSGEMEKKARKYAVTFREVLDPELLNKEGAKAEMKNGVLKMVIPKLKFEERKDVVHINVA